MIIVVFLLQAFGAPATVQRAACAATGGTPFWSGGMCYQTLASCRDADGWPVTCPDSVHCDEPRVVCL